MPKVSAITTDASLGELGSPTPGVWAYAVEGTASRRLRPEKIRDWLNPNSIFAFGAKGDGVSDDGPAFNAAMLAVWKDPERGMIHVPPFNYRIATPLVFTTTTNIFWQHGWDAWGATLVSALGAGQDVFTYNGNATEIRFLRMHGGKIDGNGTENDGWVFLCPSNTHNLHNVYLVGMEVEGVGHDGWRVTGDIFEGAMISCSARDNGHNGATIGHDTQSPQGILSSWTLFEFNAGQNGNYGVQIVNQAYDVRIIGGYFVSNGSFGLYASNGITSVSHAGFENNHTAAGSLADGNAGMYLENFANVTGCSSAPGNKQKHLARIYCVSRMRFDSCFIGTATAVYCDNGMPATADVVVNSAIWDNEDASVSRVPTYARNGVTAPQYSAPANGATITVLGTRSRAIIMDHAATIAGVTITGTASAGIMPNDGQTLTFMAPRAQITTITWSGMFATRVNVPTTLAAQGSFSIIYRKADDTWRKV